MLRTFSILCGLIAILLLTGCSNKKDILYFQNLEAKESFSPKPYKSIIKNNDLLSIIVSSSDMASAIKYNRLVPSIRDDQDTRLTGQPQLQTYLVDNDGSIDLPELGITQVAGKSRFELEQELTAEYRKYIKDVIVTIRLTNFKITILGEVNKPGTYPIRDERVTLPQALGMAGDMTVYGKRKDIILLRDNNGVQESHVIDLTQTDVLESELFYLQQNDVLVVNPNDTQVATSAFNRNNGLYVSIASLLLSVIILIAR
ncbi:polysaccharide biosynthesis/export family protein [Nonlabens antarcticus]|uniref:polysaccharide biosynthesis/export family protein n=1 Tax=Nonlabens antarcticus TaxID=392714 RepID=UPI00189189E3|nr:polysaccharide biosynthesis/export family protein [Nonlabens antarcticus]